MRVHIIRNNVNYFREAPGGGAIWQDRGNPVPRKFFVFIFLFIYK